MSTVLESSGVKTNSPLPRSSSFFCFCCANQGCVCVETFFGELEKEDDDCEKNMAPPDSDDRASSDLEEPLLSQQEQEQNGDHEEDLPLTVVNTTRNNNDNDDKDIVVSLCGRRCLKLNHNVFLNLVLSVVYGMSDSLWSGAVFAAYLKRLGNEENSIVGDIEAVNGLAVLFSALPVGYLADRCGRDKLIRAGGVLFMVTALLHGWVMTWIGTDETQMSNSKRNASLYILSVVMGLWGIGGGIVSGPAQALYADSTPVGERSQYYHYLFVVYLVSSCLGPIVSIILFQKIGDTWNLYQLRTIVYVGLGLEVTNAILMMFFDDSKSLDENGPPAAADTTEGTSALPDASSNGGTTQEEDNENGCACCNGSQDEAEGGKMTGSGPSGQAQEQDLTEPLLATGQNGTTVASSTVTSSAAADEGGANLSTDYRWLIPYIIFVGSLVFAIGSGMTVKFFPLFFKEEVGMSPSQVQMIYVLVPIVMALLSGVGTSISKFFGRVETTVLLEVLGVSCLFAMVFFKNFLDVHPFVLVPVYVMRTGLMNAPYPLMESILMDFVPKNERARWKSLESIAQFGWCGSAAVGGYVSDRWDYTHTFLITAWIQAVGILLTLCLLPLVPRSEESLSRSTSSSGNQPEQPSQGSNSTTAADDTNTTANGE